jgi:hypothetical protein
LHHCHEGIKKVGNVENPNRFLVDAELRPAEGFKQFFKGPHTAGNGNKTIG